VSPDEAHPQPAAEGPSTACRSSRARNTRATSSTAANRTPNPSPITSARATGWPSAYLRLPQVPFSSPTRCPSAPWGQGGAVANQRGRDPEAQGIAPQRPADARTGNQDAADGWSDGPLQRQGHPHPGVGPHQIPGRDKARHDTSTRGREQRGEQRGGGHPAPAAPGTVAAPQPWPIQHGLPRLGGEHQAALLDPVDQGARQRAQQGGQGAGKQQALRGRALTAKRP
jgi:hypothetical protein